MFARQFRALTIALTVMLIGAPAASAAGPTFAERDIIAAAATFFGESSESLAKLVQKVFAERGEPNAFIAGEEFSGAIGIGVRYGKGRLRRKSGESQTVYWNGCPSHLFHLSQKPWNFASPPDTLSGMHKIIEIFADRAALHTEILALRQQVAVLKRKRPRPSLRKADRVFWVILPCLWPGWRHALVIVRPETVIGWHRKGFRLFWTWKSRRRKPGRPPVSREIRHLVRRMSRENTRWGAPRIHGELLKLGFSISQAAVSKYMVRYPSPPSQSWRTFLTNHADCLASIDFFVVPTATFHLLFGFIVLHHERRQIVHFGVTANPTMVWVAQQIREAFPWGTAPRYLIRDRDGAYGQSFRSTVTAMGVEEVVTAPENAGAIIPH